MQDNIRLETAVNRPKLDNKTEITDRVSTAAIHPDVVMYTSGFFETVSVTVDRGNGVDFMTFCDQ
jgi:hypothetical protein